MLRSGYQTKEVAYETYDRNQSQPLGNTGAEVGVPVIAVVLERHGGMLNEGGSPNKETYSGSGEMHLFRPLVSSPVVSSTRKTSVSVPVLFRTGCSSRENGRSEN
jgi:hypothetical protein